MVSRFLSGVQNDPGDFSCVGSAACPVGLKAFRSPEGAEEYFDVGQPNHRKGHLRYRRLSREVVHHH